MVVYIEYAFLWNLLLDGALLWLALRASKTPVKYKNLLFSALLGGAFALIFPLLALPDFLSYLLKFSFGFLLCLIASGRVKTKKEWGRYALNCVFFFSFTFAFGGAVTGLAGNDAKKGVIVLVFALLTAFSLLLIKKFHEKRAVEKCVYDCAILYKQRRTAVFGFYDSGNFALHKGAPVCFVSPDLFYDIWGEALAFADGKTGGQVCDETEITTMSGVKKVRLFPASLQIVTKEGKIDLKEVYFSPSAHMVSREYKLLLNSRIFEEK